MGLFYNIVSPFVGGRQPLEQRKLTPPGGPAAPDNPPFTGARVRAEVLIAWAAPAAAVILPHLMVPQAEAAPPPKRTPEAIFQAWDTKAPAAQRSARLVISGPAPEAPPIIGARVPLPVQVWWIPPPPEPQTAILLNPPIAGPSPEAPPVKGAREPLAVQVSWIPPPPASQSTILLKPPIAGPVVGPIGRTGIPAAVMAWWNATPVYITLELPPAPEVVPDAPPGRPGVSQAVLDSWRSEFLANQERPWLAPLIPVAVADTVLRRGLPQAVLDSWLARAPDQQERPWLAPLLPAAADTPIPRRADLAAVLASWQAVPDLILPARARLIQEPPAPQAPPTGLGGRIPSGTLTWFIPPPPMPQWVRYLDPPISGPAPEAPPLQRPQDHPWPAEVTFPAQPRRLLVFEGAAAVQPPPPRDLEAVLTSWVTADHQRLPARRLLIPLPVESLPVGARIPVAVFEWWEQKPFAILRRAQRIESGPDAPPPLVRAVHLVGPWWQVPVEPIRPRLVVPPSGPTPDNPPPLVRASYLTEWWVAAPMPVLRQLAPPPSAPTGNPVLYAVSTVVQWGPRSTLTGSRPRNYRG